MDNLFETLGVYAMALVASFDVWLVMILVKVAVLLSYPVLIIIPCIINRFFKIIKCDNISEKIDSIVDKIEHVYIKYICYNGFSSDLAMIIFILPIWILLSMIALAIINPDYIESIYDIMQKIRYLEK